MLEVIHSDDRMCLVFEFLDCDLKKYMDAASQAADAAEAAAVNGGAGLGLGVGMDVDGVMQPPVAAQRPKSRARRGLPADLVAVRPLGMLLNAAVS